MSDLSLIDAAGQILIVGFPGGPPPSEFETWIKRGTLGGAILFKRNIGTFLEVAELNRRLSKDAPRDRPLLISVDQEGGRVARILYPGLKLPPMRALASLGDKALIRKAATIQGQQLRALGFTMNFAPVLDIDTNPANPVIGDRAFGTTPEVVIEYAYAFAEGLKNAGILACGKHFPGHGDTISDSHLELPSLAHDRKRLDAVELAPFRQARATLPSLMTAHVVFRGLDPNVPATLSKHVITGLLRDELQYDGVIISDDLEMKAIADNYGVGDAATQAIAAGCDSLLICSKPELVFEAHESLVKKAEKDSSFAARLKDAARRCIAMRQEVAAPSPLTDTVKLRALFDENTEARALEAEIAKRLSL